MVFSSVDAFALLVGFVILGAGYLGSTFKNFLSGGDFKSLSSFDKFMYSLVLGSFSFILSIRFFLPMDNGVESVSFLNMIFSETHILVFQFVVSLVIAWDWFLLEFFFFKKQSILKILKGLRIQD